MSSVAIIGDIDTVSGFRLGGVKKAEVVTTAEEAIAAEREEPAFGVPTADAGTIQPEEESNSWNNVDKADEDDLDVPPSLRARLRGKK